MSPETHAQMANFIWSICNLLRGPYKRNEYRKVILPLTVLRRFDCILAPTKQAVLDEHKKFKGVNREITGVKLIAPELIAVVSALSERDETADICTNRNGEPEPDSALRDTEMVPLKESIEDYFEREVKPHVPDAWIDFSKTKVGYELPLTRHFYQYEPPRPLEEIEADLAVLEKRIVTMLKEVVG